MNVGKLPNTGDFTVQVVLHDESTGFFSLNTEELEKLLLSPRYAGLKVQLISVAGAFRHGKSFLLNFFVKYLKFLQNTSPSGVISAESLQNNSWMLRNRSSLTQKYNFDMNESSAVYSDEEEKEVFVLPDWITDQQDRYIRGFKWRGGSQRETTGIIMWKEPFIIDTGVEKIVVLLMDTQGTFDWSSTVKSCATVFALSSMLSSVQIYNLTHNVQEDDLNHLQYFTEYGRLALQDSDLKPFQHLIFVVRDWSYSYEFPFGPCEQYLEKILSPNPGQPTELQTVRKHIHECFEKLGCYLIPFPGESVASKVRFKGNINSINKKFLCHVADLVETVLNPDNIKPRTFDGREILCKELFYYFQSYMKVFQSNSLPEPKTLLLATAEAGHLAAFKESQEKYMDEMNKFAGGDRPYLAKDTLEFYHRRALEGAIENYETSKKMGDKEMNAKYLEQLNDAIEKRYDEFVKNNEGKNLVKSFRFLIIAILFFVINLVFSEIFDFIGIYFLQYPFILMGRLSLMLICFWMYLKLSGHFTEPLVLINTIADAIWDISMNYVQDGVVNMTGTQVLSSVKGDERRSVYLKND